MPDRPRRKPVRTPKPATESPDDGLVLVGRVLAPWGLRGEVRVQAISTNPARFARGARLLLNGVPRRVLASRPGPKGQLVVLLEGIATPEAAAEFRGAELKAPADEAPPLEQDWYYHFQLIGLTVVTDEGRELGTLVEVLETGANDVYIVRGGEREYLIPAIADVVQDVDLSARRMTIHVLEGLLD